MLLKTVQVGMNFTNIWNEEYIDNLDGNSEQDDDSYSDDLDYMMTMMSCWVAMTMTMLIYPRSPDPPTDVENQGVKDLKLPKKPPIMTTNWSMRMLIRRTNLSSPLPLRI